jgi:NADPH:quinone reductase-like Zn-dependent oxidoreductase
MKAYVFHQYGSPDVLEFQEVEKPSLNDDQVLVRICATSVNPAEWYGLSGLPIARIGSGLLKPKDPRLGTDYAGVVEAVGRNVKAFKPGDEVFGGRNGAFAEYVAARAEGALALKPANVTFEQAAAVPIAALTALQGLRDHGQLQPGQKVLINGGSGGVGTFAVQIAKALGAEVTAVCSPRNVERMCSLGADHVVDYTRDDFTRGPRRYDLLLDIAGSRSWAECKRVLNPKARFVIVGGPKTNRIIGPLSHMLKVSLGALGASQKVGFFVAQMTQADMVAMQGLLASGQVTPVIDRQYAWSKLPDAMRYLGEGHAKGKIVVTVRPAADKR